jgi:hypothetical protein
MGKPDEYLMKFLPLLLLLVSSHLLALPLPTIGEDYDTLIAKIKTEYLTGIREDKQKESYKRSIQDFFAKALEEKDYDGSSLAQVVLVEAHLRRREIKEAEVEFSILEIQCSGIVVQTLKGLPSRIALYFGDVTTSWLPDA